MAVHNAENARSNTFVYNSAYPTPVNSAAIVDAYNAGAASYYYRVSANRFVYPVTTSRTMTVQITNHKLDGLSFCAIAYRRLGTNI